MGKNKIYNLSRNKNINMVEKIIDIKRIGQIRGFNI